ncbi:pilus assembly PilX family protein [Variovorax sp. LT2P21]|uniref:pilus assembly PilX family protein n=1 Tax=Variovorax sp. LT2P21 TaxID=3443731 RepID=UPI003F44F06B
MKYKAISSIQNQRGISLFVVLVMVLLTTLLVLWSSRTALLNELISGVDSDYQRALEAAQAMAKDAELDIKGSSTSGAPCSSTHCREFGVIDVAANKAFFPADMNEYWDMDALLRSSEPPCVAAVCVPGANATFEVNEFWRNTTNLAAMKTKAATYGQFTGAETGSASNPLLVPSRNKAWYWVELLPYDYSASTRGGAAKSLAPDDTTPLVYRITAIAEGVRPQTQAVVQTIFVWKRLNS